MVSSSRSQIKKLVEHAKKANKKVIKSGTSLLAKGRELLGIKSRSAKRLYAAKEMTGRRSALGGTGELIDQLTQPERQSLGAENVTSSPSRKATPTPPAEVASPSTSHEPVALVPNSIQLKQTPYDRWAPEAIDLPSFHRNYVLSLCQYEDNQNDDAVFEKFVEMAHREHQHWFTLRYLVDIKWTPGDDASVRDVVNYFMQIESTCHTYEDPVDTTCDYDLPIAPSAYKFNGLAGQRRPIKWHKSECHLVKVDDLVDILVHDVMTPFDWSSFIPDLFVGDYTCRNRDSLTPRHSECRLLSTCYYSLMANGVDGIVMAPDVYLPFDETQLSQLDPIISKCYRQYAALVQKLCVQIRELAVTAEEVVLLKLIVLFSSPSAYLDANGYRCVDKCKAKYRRLLLDLERLRYVGDESTAQRRLADLATLFYPLYKCCAEEEYVIKMLDQYEEARKRLEVVEQRYWRINIVFGRGGDEEYDDDPLVSLLIDVKARIETQGDRTVDDETMATLGELVSELTTEDALGHGKPFNVDNEMMDFTEAASTCIDYLRERLIAFYEAGTGLGRFESRSTALWEQVPFMARLSAELHKLLNSDKFRLDDRKRETTLGGKNSGSDIGGSSILPIVPICPIPSSTISDATPDDLLSSHFDKMRIVPHSAFTEEIRQKCLLCSCEASRSISTYSSYRSRMVSKVEQVKAALLASCCEDSNQEGIISDTDKIDGEEAMRLLVHVWIMLRKLHTDNKKVRIALFELAGEVRGLEALPWATVERPPELVALLDSLDAIYDELCKINSAIMCMRRGWRLLRHSSAKAFGGQKFAYERPKKHGREGASSSEVNPTASPHRVGIKAVDSHAECRGVLPKLDFVCIKTGLAGAESDSFENSVHALSSIPTRHLYHQFIVSSSDNGQAVAVEQAQLLHRRILNAYDSPTTPSCLSFSSLFIAVNAESLDQEVVRCGLMSKEVEAMVTQQLAALLLHLAALIHPSKLGIYTDAHFWNSHIDAGREFEELDGMEFGHIFACFKLWLKYDAGRGPENETKTWAPDEWALREESGDLPNRPLIYARGGDSSRISSAVPSSRHSSPSSDMTISSSSESGDDDDDERMETEIHLGNAGCSTNKKD